MVLASILVTLAAPHFAEFSEDTCIDLHHAGAAVLELCRSNPFSKVLLAWTCCLIGAAYLVTRERPTKDIFARTAARTWFP